MAERKGYMVHWVICLTEVALCDPMLDEVLGLMDAILVNGVNSIQKDRTIWMFGNYHKHA